MSVLNVKIKRLSPDAVIPKYAKFGDAGSDLVAISVKQEYKYIEYGTGLAIEIPYGYVGLIFPRSSGSDYDQILANCVGVIDSGYRGEIKFRFKISLRANFWNQLLDKDTMKFYQIKDKIGQLIIIPIPKVEFEEVEELSATERGTGSYGSTGK
jgi:dUTP pyrophosphatase